MELSEIALNTLLQRYELLPDLPQYHGKWSYDIGVVLLGVKKAYQLSGDQKLLEYIQATMDRYVQVDGTIKNYHVEQMNSDSINNGKLLLFLYQETGVEKYKKAADTLYQQIQQMPRTPEGGFWHKKIYQQQMWLDGVYMVEPFYAEYSVMFAKADKIDDVLQQFKLIYEKTVDDKTGLLFHAWNSDSTQPWADVKTGHSPHFWGRAMGWYLMALVDTYEIIKPMYPQQAEVLRQLFNKLIPAIKKAQDPQSHVWYQVLDEGSRRGNYLEASVSSMFVYATAKAIRLKMITADNQLFVEKAYQGLADEFVFFTKEKWLNLIRNCQVAGLGGDDERDGSFTYYISEPIITNDFKGYGAFLLAALEVENLK